jgi:protein tyrosine/serine phosphatase
MMRKTAIFTLYLLSFLSLNAQDAIKINDLGLKNFYQINEGLFRSEQPEKSQFIVLKEYGIKEVLSLRLLHSDNKESKEANLKLHRVKMRASKIKDEDVIAALKIIKKREGSLLIHCKYGSDRTGVIVAMYRIVFQNWSKEKAIEEMTSDKFGFHAIYTNIIEYIMNSDVDYIKKHLEIESN